MLKNKRGITLIALVITIIVLLILAGVSIAMITGDNGIINRASEAKQKTEDKSKEELDKLSQVDENIDKALGKDTSEFGKLKESNAFVAEKKVVEDKNGDFVTIPNGFKIAADSGNSVIEGIVIEDDDVVGSGTGNQYVWVPVTLDANGDPTELYAETGTLSNGEEIKLDRYVFETDGSMVNMGADSIRGYIGIGEKPSYPNTPLWVTNEEYENIEIFKSSVAENGGYYVARYEASFGEDLKANSKKTTLYDGEFTEGRLWNYINHADAIAASQNLYLDMTSDLINSYAYDTAVVYIQKCSNDSDYSRSSTQKEELRNTGTNGDKMCNIHDLAGNLAEWTTETGYWAKLGSSTLGSSSNTLFGFAARGGRYNDIDCWVTFRGASVGGYGNEENEETDYLGFRTVLYF